MNDLPGLWYNRIMDIIDNLEETVISGAMTEAQLKRAIGILARASDILSQRETDRFARCTEELMKAEDRLLLNPQ